MREENFLRFSLLADLGREDLVNAARTTASACMVSSTPRKDQLILQLTAEASRLTQKIRRWPEEGFQEADACLN